MAEKLKPVTNHEPLFIKFRSFDKNKCVFAISDTLIVF